MAEFIRARPLLLLFVVAALGCLLGRLRVRGFSLGVAAVLFAGLLLGWWIPGIQLPDFIAQLGLVLFVYTLGLASGPAFFASLRLRGVRDNLLALGVLSSCALAAWPASASRAPYMRPSVESAWARAWASTAGGADCDGAIWLLLRLARHLGHRDEPMLATAKPKG